jgi:hypothetical protein
MLWFHNTFLSYETGEAMCTLHLAVMVCAWINMDYLCITIEFNFTMAIGADATTTLMWVAGLTSPW